MRGTIKQIAVWTMLIGYSTMVFAVSEFRIPLDVNAAAHHYPLHREDEGEGKQFFDLWASGYTRVANQCYLKHGTKKAPLSALFFGKTDFIGKDIFEGSRVNYPRNPWLRFAKISPRFDYTERGVVLGVGFEKRLCKNQKWRVGARARVPLKVIEVERENSKLSESKDDFVDFRVETINGVHYPDNYAFNLAFLSALSRDGSWNASNFVQYGNGTSATRMASVNVEDNVYLLNLPPILLRRSDDGKFPTVGYGVASNSSTSVQNLAADGSGGADGGLARFVAGTNYVDGIEADIEAQKKLFVVPLIESALSVMAKNAQHIRIAVNAILDVIDPSVEAFFTTTRKISFDTQKTVAFGDLMSDLYVGCQVRDSLYGEGRLEISFPTGPKNKNPQQLLKVPAGNNGHFEIGLGSKWCWDAHKYIKISLGSCYTWVLEATEKRATAYADATVKNIGYTTDAKVKWQHWRGDIDFTLVHPYNKNLVFNAGYQVYRKGKDKITFVNTTANDLTNISRTLDSTVMTKDTNTLSHKARGELYHRVDYCQAFMGLSHVFAGRNAPKETDFYIGFNVEF